VKKEELDCTLFRNDLGKSYGPFVKNLPDDDDDNDDGGKGIRSIGMLK